MGQAGARARHQGVAIRFVVPFGEEGAADRAARAFSLSLGTASFTVENVPGEGGSRGLARANALAEAGEPVLLLSTPTTHILLPAQGRGAPHERFAPLAGLGSAPNVLLVPPVLGVRSVEDLVALARRRTLTYASAGAGQTIHVCAACFAALAGVRMEHRPYEGGSATAYADFVAGRVQVYFDSLLGCRERIDAGDAIPLAVSSVKRSALLPGVPTLAECGYAHALDVWLGVFVGNAPLDVSPLMRSSFGDTLSALGLDGGPLDARALALQVESSSGPWLRALEAIS